MPKKRHLSASQFIALGYLIVILFGTLLLCLPIASRDLKWTNPLVALFTATSATCVTGLSVVETGTYWSLFGKIVILLLIQIGGIGFMTIISLLAVALKRKINLHERKIIMQSSGSIGIAGVIQLIKKIVFTTILCELIGAIIIFTQLIQNKTYSVGDSIFYALFLAVSAFCNAGFDPIKNNATSLMIFVSHNFVLNITIMLLIIIGGFGFIVWSDIFCSKGKWKKMQLYTKMVIITSLSLIIIPAILFYIFEYNNAYKDLNTLDALTAAFFQSVTCRTAGFLTVDQLSLSPQSILLSLFLMFVGGAPGSTAGGIKVTTLVVLILSVLCAARRKENIVVGKRQLEGNITKQASAIATLYLFLIILSSIIIMAIEANGKWHNIGNMFVLVLYETTSAIGTVGLSMGGTANLLWGSKIILIFLMYFGRVGALSIIFMFSERMVNEDELLQRPTEKILIG